MPTDLSAAKKARDLAKTKDQISKAASALTKAYALVSDLEEHAASDTEAWYDWLDTSLLLAETGALLAQAYARQAMDD